MNWDIGPRCIDVSVDGVQNYTFAFMVPATPSQRVTAIATALLAVIGVGVAMHELSGILIPFILAGFLSILYKPLVHFLRSKHIPMAITLLIVLGITAGALWGVYMIVAVGIDSFTDKQDFYTVQLKHVLTNFESTLGSVLRGMGQRGTFRFEKLITAESVTGIATAQVYTLLSLLSDGVMVLLYLVFMLSAGDVFPLKIKAAFPGEGESPALVMFQTLNSRVRKYLQVKTLFNVVNGLVTWGILELFGVDFAPVIGLLTFLFHYIPNIGSVISTGIPGLVYLLQTNDLKEVAILMLILVIVQNVIGNVIEPKVMGDTLELSPVVVLFSLIFWGWMWGVVGMILSIPIMSVVKALLESVPATRPIAILMGSSSSAPTPDEAAAK